MDLLLRQANAGTISSAREQSQRALFGTPNFEEQFEFNPLEMFSRPSVVNVNDPERFFGQPTIPPLFSPEEEARFFAARFANPNLSNFPSPLPTTGPLPPIRLRSLVAPSLEAEEILRRKNLLPNFLPLGPLRPRR